MAMVNDNGVDGQSVAWLPIIVLFAVGVSKLFFSTRFRDLYYTKMAIEGLVALLIHFYVLPVPSIVPWWSLSTTIASQWTRGMIPNDTASKPNQTASFRTSLLNGPLGPGAWKIVHLITAICLWRIIQREWPEIKFFGNSRKYPGLLEWIILVGISIAVNMVLYLWSRISKSKGLHKGVERMVSSSKHRNDLTLREQLLYGFLAFVNATCEEITFRWFFRSEFAVYIPDRDNKNLFCFDANVVQAVVFGVLHYYGIPSGMAGVCLTFVYGWIMGILMEQVGDGGLFLPIVAHTIADYYIFTSVARGKAVGK